VVHNDPALVVALDDGRSKHTQQAAVMEGSERAVAVTLAVTGSTDEGVLTIKVRAA
jgi:hypothetical protein